MLEFTKMQGLGNDYIYVDCFSQSVEHPERLAVRLSERNFSVGANGLVLILPSDVADFKMRMFNADGSEGKMCGNAVRCIGKYVYEKGMTDRTELTLETLSGVKTLSLHVTDGKVQTVSVDIGAPAFAPADIPLLADHAQNLKLHIAEADYTAFCVSMGNPHCVLFVPDVDGAPVVVHGPIIERMPIFPERVNVEFVQLCGENHLKMRVWERGSGETLACGTGACAVAVAAVKRGLCGPDVRVDLRGGTLRVRYADDAVTLTGPAEFVYEGKIQL